MKETLLKMCDGWGKPVSEKLPPEVSSRRDAQIRYCASRGCLWCFTLNLLGGDFLPVSLRLFDGDDRKDLLAHASELQAERERYSKRRRGKRRVENVPTQGVLA